MNFGSFWLPWLQNPSKIGSGSDQNGNSKTRCKKVSTNPEKIQKLVSKWGPRSGHFLPPGPFLLSQAALGPKMTPKASPKSPWDQSKPRFNPQNLFKNMIFEGLGALCRSISFQFLFIICSSILQRKEARRQGIK